MAGPRAGIIAGPRSGSHCRKYCRDDNFPAGGEVVKDWLKMVW